MEINKNNIIRLCLVVVVQDILDTVIKIVDTRPKNKYIVNYLIRNIYVINMKAKELGQILLAMGVIVTSCNDKQIQLQDVKGVRLENNIVTLS